MSHVAESASRDSRRARRRRTLITLAVVALMLFFAFWYAYSYYRASGQAAATGPTPTCTRTTAPTPATITVNVYNATDRNGLAARTAEQVRKRGFKVGSVSNDPLSRTIKGTAEVRYGKAGEASSKLVRALVTGAKAHPDTRTDASVDLVLGNSFKALAPVPKSKAKPTTKPTATATTSGGC